MRSVPQLGQNFASTGTLSLQLLQLDLSKGEPHFLQKAALSSFFSPQAVQRIITFEPELSSL
jgi:hypothetical protein